MTEPHPQVARALALHPLLTREGDEANRRRELTPPVVAALKDGDFFRMLQPRSIGGMETEALGFAQVTEAISAADGSWLGGLPEQRLLDVAAYLDPRVAREYSGPVDGILAWGPPGSPFEAEPVPGGYTASPAPGASPAAARTPLGSARI